jgi:hypothetical protein
MISSRAPHHSPPRGPESSGRVGRDESRPLSRGFFPMRGLTTPSPRLLSISQGDEMGRDGTRDETSRDESGRLGPFFAWSPCPRPHRSSYLTASTNGPRGPWSVQRDRRRNGGVLPPEPQEWDPGGEGQRMSASRRATSSNSRRGLRPTRVTTTTRRSTSQSRA